MNEKSLKNLLKFVYENLNENGIFMIWEHDISRKYVFELAHIAHIIFNATFGVSFEDEKSEIWNFKDIKEWHYIL